MLTKKGVKGKIENVMITSGGLEPMNLVCQLYIDPGDVILVESPTFVHSKTLQAELCPWTEDKK
ncbi:hypothetical protein [Geosporobacter subterraneus]|uniref:hypothetical protein n=1 Tax=Geosporobacter subterraneus TaxID=390806 RepID=UPI001FA9221B|nr:hypothetical protein [Geosporobacter subterraneus]